MTSSHAPQLDGFELVRELGSGGYSDVFLYAQQSPRREVAIKVLRADALTSEARDQITATAEVDAMALADHPFIVPVFEAGIAPDGRPYIVMKYYPRPDYATRVRTDRFSVVDVLRTGVQIACAVETAHRAGILHRDIKPVNILTDAYGSPGLADFGIAVATGRSSSESEGLSVPWAAPEVIFGTAPQDVYSDIYSLAATLWHLLVGRSPFEVTGGDNSTVALMGRIRSTPPPATGRGDVPPSLEHLLRVGLAKQPDQRPRTAADLARALQAIEQEQRFPLTPLVLVDPSVERLGPAAGQGEGELTHVRAVRVVDAQRPLPSEPSAADPTRAGVQIISDVPVVPAGGSASMPNRRRDRAQPPTVAPPETHRVVRADQLETPTTATPTQSGSGRGRRIGLAAVGVCVVAAAAIAVVLADGGGKAHVSNPPHTPPASLPGTLAPGTPVVKVRRVNATHIQFSWKYSAALDDDTYRWTRSGSGPTRVGRSKMAKLLVAVPRGKPVCLTVEVVRYDGALSQPSNVVCSN